MTGYVIVCRGMPGVNLGPGGDPVGAYLESFDPEAHGGIGVARWTRDKAKAMRFPSFTAAMECWRTVPASRPLRGDGKPNRPLTAYTVTVQAAP